MTCRVAVACANPKLLVLATRRLRLLGIAAYACPTMSELAAFAEGSNMVIVFADSFNDRPSTVAALRALERWSLGPALIVVAGPAFEWEPSATRTYPTLRVPPSFFDWALEQSEPELPFTD